MSVLWVYLTLTKNKEYLLDSEKEKAMGRNRKTYSESFKKHVAIEAMDGKKTVAEIASSNNIAPGMVSAWKKAFVNGAAVGMEYAPVKIPHVFAQHLDRVDHKLGVAVFSDLPCKDLPVEKILDNA